MNLSLITLILKGLGHTRLGHAVFLNYNDNLYSFNFFC